MSNIFFDKYKKYKDKYVKKRNNTLVKSQWVTMCEDTANEHLEKN